jgi:hypothetical protein
MTSLKRAREAESDADLRRMDLRAAFRPALVTLEQMLEEGVKDKAVLSTRMGATEFKVPGCAGGFRHVVTRLEFRCEVDPDYELVEDDLGTDGFLEFMEDEHRRELQHWTRVMEDDPPGSLVEDVMQAENRFPKGTLVAVGPGGCRVRMMRFDTEVSTDLFKGPTGEWEAAKKAKVAAKAAVKAAARAAARAAAKAAKVGKAKGKAE